MTARRHRPADVDEGPPCSRSRRSFGKSLLKMFCVGFLLLIVGGTGSNDILRGAVVAGGALTLIPFGVGLLWLCVGMIRAGAQLGRQVGQGVRAVQQPLPSPQQIEQALAQHLGRQPTISEIAGLQQLLANDRQAKISDGLVSAAGLVIMNLIGRGNL